MDRFWGKVQKTDSCWLWQGATRGANGYGSFVMETWKDPVTGKWPVKLEYSHRVAWFLTYGFWPEYLMHTCDEPLCVNPGHLVRSSHKENIEDRQKKGRQAWGEKNGKSRLTLEQAEEVRRRYAEGGCSHRSLAAEFGVAHNVIGQILRGRSYIEP